MGTWSVKRRLSAPPLRGAAERSNRGGSSAATRSRRVGRGLFSAARKNAGARTRTRAVTPRHAGGGGEGGERWRESAGNRAYTISPRPRRASRRRARGTWRGGANLDGVASAVSRRAAPRRAIRDSRGEGKLAGRSRLETSGGADQDGRPIKSAARRCVLFFARRMAAGAVAVRRCIDVMYDFRERRRRRRRWRRRRRIADT